MSERRAAAKGRRMGSSRRKQLREGSREAPAAAPGPGEEVQWASEIVQRVQDFFRERDKDQAGFVTRSDMQKLQEEDFPCSTEELELVFDGLDAAGTGQLSTEEFTAGLWQFLSSQKAAREHRRRKTASRRVRLVIPSPVLEGVDSEERRHFAAFMDQLGMDNISEEQEIWQLWVKLRQDEPQLLGNLEDFLAKMRHRIQEARSKKEALEVTLNKRVAEHDKEVQQLCEALEQQIQQEQQRLEQESMARSHQHGVELQQALDASEREVQRLVTAQTELETRCRSLRSTQQATSTENQQLEESNRVLEEHLQRLHQQLQQTHGRLQTARAVVAREHAEEPRDRAVAELPGEMPLSPQMSPESHSEMRISLGSQSTEPKAKSTHKVVWEMLPAETSIWGAVPRVSSVEEDPFPEFLKEEHFSDQSSLLSEMNEAIAALSQQPKPQALGAPPADAARHPQDDVEPQMGLEAAAAHGKTPGVLRETLPGHVGHELFEGDLKEGPATAEVHAPDVRQAGASAGAGHRRAQEPGAEQGESPEEAWKMLFLQGKGAGVKELVLKAAEHPQGAPGESVEAGEQALVEVEGEGWMQEKAGWEKAQLLGEAEEVAVNQGENLEAGLGPPEAGEAGLAAGWQLGPAAAPGEFTQPPGAGLGEEADLPSGLPEKLEIKPGERLEPELLPWGEAQLGAAQGDGVLPEVAVAPAPGMLEEECVGAEVQPWGEPLGAEEPPAQRGGSIGAGAEEGEVEVTQPGEAEPQPWGESVRGGAGWGGSVGAGVLLPPTNVWEGGEGTDVQPLEAQSSDGSVQLHAEAALQPGAGSPGTEQGRGVAPGVQPREGEDEPELGLGAEMGATVVHGEGPSPAQTPAGSLCGLFPVKAQALELVEADESWADTQLHGATSPETLQGGGECSAEHLVEEAEDGAQGPGEHGLALEPGLNLQGEGAGAGVRPWEEAGSLDREKDQSTDAGLELLADVDRPKLTPGRSMEGDLQPLSEVSSPGTEQGGSVVPDVQPLDQIDNPELVDMEAEESWVDTQLHGDASPETLPGRGDHSATHLGDEAENLAQGPGEHGLALEPGLHPHGVAIAQGEGAGAGMWPWEEAGSLDREKDQSTDAGLQPLAEVDRPKLTPGGNTEGDLESLSEVSSPGTEQGGSLAPDDQVLGRVDNPELVDMEAEESWEDTQLHGGASPETLQQRGDHSAEHLMEEAEDGAQGPGEHGLALEPGLDLQGEWAGAGVRPWEEAGSLDRERDQSTDAGLQPLAEVDRPKLTPGGSVDGDLEPLSEVSSRGTEQGLSLAPDDQALGWVDNPELVDMEAEESWADMQLHGGASPETLQQRGDHSATHLGDEAENLAQGPGEHGLALEPGLHPHGVAIAQGEGAGAGMWPWEEAGSLDREKDQNTDATLQPLAEVDRPKLTPGGSVDGDLEPLSEVSSRGTEQGGSLAPDDQALGRVDNPELVDMEAEESWVDMQLHGDASPETLPGNWECSSEHLMEEAEDGAQGPGEHGLALEPGLNLQGEGAGAGVGLWEEAGSLDREKDQSTDAGLELLADVDRPKLTPGRSMEGDLQPLSEVSSRGTEQGGSVVPDVQPLDQIDNPELVDMEAEESWVDMQLHGDASPETLPGNWECSSEHLMEEAEDGAQGPGEHGLALEPGLDLQGEGAGAGVGLWEEAGSLDREKDQSTDAGLQPLAEVDRPKLAPGGTTEGDLEPLSEVSSRGTEQGGSLAPDDQALDQVDNPELVDMEAEESWVDTQLHGAASPETLQGNWECSSEHLVEEAEDGAQGLGEHGLALEPGLHPHGVAIAQGEGAGAGMWPWEEAGSLDREKDQSTDAGLQPLAEVDRPKLAPGGNTEGDLESLSEVSSPGTEQGGSLAPDDQALGRVDNPELVDMEAEVSWEDTQLHGAASPETLQQRGDHSAEHLMEEAEDGAQGPGEHGLALEPGLDLQGEGAGAGVRPWEEAGSLDREKDQSTDAGLQPLAEVGRPKLTPGGSAGGDPASLSAVGVQEGEPSQTPGLEAGLCAPHPADVRQGAADARVSPPVEAALHPGRAAAAQGPGLEAMVGALTGPDGQILEDIQTLEIWQGERADSEERPLDGAQGLEVVEGERLEAGARILVETQSLGIKQGHDDGASVLGPLVSEVTLQISTLKLETMMQEDVLVPDVQRLGASGQAAQSQLQEQVSAQADQVRLHAASQQLEKKPPHMMETEQVAAGPATPPKQEVPPASTLYTRIQPEEDAGNDQSGVVLGYSLLGDAASRCLQPQRQLLGEQSKDLNVGQWKKQQEVGQKTSQEGKPSPGEPEAMTADGAGAAPKGSPEASIDPDHLYNVLFVGDSHVGKTSFLYRLHADTFNPHLTATVGLDYQVKNLIVDNKRFALRLWDSAGQERYHSITKQFFRKADGVVLMYDITSEYSFSDVRYWLSCIQEGAEDGVAILLLGNKTDCAAGRQVPTTEGERLAKEHKLMFYECSAASGHNVSESMVSLIRLLKVREGELKNKAQEVPKPPQKKKGCCW